MTFHDSVNSYFQDNLVLVNAMMTNLWSSTSTDKIHFLSMIDRHQVRDMENAQAGGVDSYISYFLEWTRANKSRTLGDFFALCKSNKVLLLVQKDPLRSLYRQWRLSLKKGESMQIDKEAIVIKGPLKGNGDLCNPIVNEATNVINSPVSDCLPVYELACALPKNLPNILARDYFESDATRISRFASQVLNDKETLQKINSIFGSGKSALLSDGITGIIMLLQSWYSDPCLENDPTIQDFCNFLHENGLNQLVELIYV